MKIKMLALSLIVAVLADSEAAAVSVKKSKVIELVEKDGGSKIATIRINQDSLLFESAGSSDSFLFTDEAFFTINNKDQTYRVQSHAELEAAANRKAAEIAQSPENAGAVQGVELKLTKEIGTVSRLRVRKLIKITKGEPEAEFWVSSELMPTRLRALGEKIRSILPKDYWARVHGNPGMVEIIMLFGVPLKMVSKGQSSYGARVVAGPSSDLSFEVPKGYRKLDN